MKPLLWKLKKQDGNITLLEASLPGILIVVYKRVLPFPEDFLRPDQWHWRVDADALDYCITSKNPLPHAEDAQAAAQKVLEKMMGEQEAKSAVSATGDENPDVMYAIAFKDEKGEMGFTDGPTPHLPDLLALAPTQDGSGIYRLSKSGRCERLYDWTGDTWKEL